MATSSGKAAQAIYPPSMTTTGMTPIHIRGKKRVQPLLTGKTAVEEATNKKHRNNIQNGGLYSLKDRSHAIRSLKHRQNRENVSRSATPSVFAVSTTSLHHEYQQQQQSQPSAPRSPSALESLPPELLQQIFLHVCNPALPLASPLLASKLSHPHIYTQFCVRVFCHLTCRSKNVWRIAGGADEDDEVLMKWRNQALKWRWMSWEFFDKASTLLVDAEGKRLREEVFSKGSTQIDRSFHAAGLRLWLGDKVRIPSRLLRWPCSGVKFEFLRALIRSGGTVDVTTLDYEVVREAWLEAVKDKDYRLVHLLMAPGVFKQPGLDTLRQAVQQAEGDVAMGKLIVEMGDFGGFVGHPGAVMMAMEEVEMDLFDKPREKWYEENDSERQARDRAKLRDGALSGEEEAAVSEDDFDDPDYFAIWTQRYRDDKIWVEEAGALDDNARF